MSQAGRVGNGEAVVLVADDDAVTRRLLCRHLEAAGYQVIEAADGAEATAHLTTDLAVALIDLQMPRVSGLDCLRHAQRHCPDLPVLVISQFSEVRDAVAAMKEGAFDYVTKPVDPEELLVHVAQARRSARLTQENRQLKEVVGGSMPAEIIGGDSAASRTLFEQIEKIVPIDATVLITGESGTGKTTIARFIHQHGPRGSQPFVVVNCGALPRELIEAELFGHVRGAFTGAVADRPGRADMADGGTLFLDEIGDLPLELQPKLLAFLQDRIVEPIGGGKRRKVDVRVIAATHQDLESKVAAGAFRQDLYFRLNVLPITVPPLRERPEDVPLLCDHILRRIAGKRGQDPFVLREGAREKLVQHRWPGNVRELENVLERATAFATDREIDVDDLGFAADVVSAPPGEGGRLAGRTLEEIERQAIVETLEWAEGNKKQAARTLGIDEKSIYNKMKRLGISWNRG
ncbi:Transcriptional regulatory protein ZraR [Planctomycetes bacterium Pan216]|uniref:Transcriptional regulatory protein ZraR n=1 Tax=Kolteria novifilia TaxID=2527975 RepID=A0A518B420_9BACT|nr:Transcriptional regulatory protein ZraR [Planctomycetes bacterium Pan216]